ncbi:hypothetical protein TanjilG_18572 [Lupinus angustifolius]|uniref:SHSP domain-containing protein n=1 Tax=Lupinus angustifolius TaxID=3871 RepID=A0A394DBW4_LUPAN|nr:hypothetical protein TanjilG_18572 [Lupinus angustifolius]
MHGLVVPPFSSQFPCETSSLGNIDAHMFREDVSRLKKEEVKVEIEDGRIVRWIRRLRHGTLWSLAVERFEMWFRLWENVKAYPVKAVMEKGF